MKLKFLGTGTSTGVPEIGCPCTVCTSQDKKDRRFRASALLHTDDSQILIDCGPDFRAQMLDEKFEKIDGVLITHEHYDHVGGLDDLRPFCRFGDIDIYSNKITIGALRRRIPYCFRKYPYPGVPTFNTHSVAPNRTFRINNTEIQPIVLMHYKLPIYGYRIQNFAYLTDVKTIPDKEIKKLQGLDTLVINALRFEEHLSHQNLEEALAAIERIAPQKAYLIHMSHHMGLHEDAQKLLPEHVYFAYDGLEIDV